MKTCKECGESKPLDQYGKNKAGRGGLYSQCKTGRSVKRRARYAADPAKANAQNNAYYAANREKVLEDCANYARANLEKTNAKSARWIKNNPERAREIRIKSHAVNRDARNVLSAKWRAMRLNATPAWHETDAVNLLYLDSATRAEPHHVDHVIPLQHPLVCGLHCLANLQVIPALENLQKNNRFSL